MSREKLAVANKGLAGTIRRLRERLGELEGAEVTQEEMARRVGAKIFPYQNWERGRTIVPGVYVLRMLPLCPDDETRDAFFVDIAENNSKIRSTPRAEKESPPGARIKLETKNPRRRS